MDNEHEKIKTTIETDNALLKQGIDEYQFKIKKTSDMKRVNDVEAIIFEQKMTDASEHDLFLSPDAL